MIHIPKLYFDLDNVIANFNRQMEIHFNLDEGGYLPLPHHVRKEYVEQLKGTSFFYDIEPYKEVDALLKYAMNYSILTTPLSFDYINSCTNKKKFIEEKLSIQPKEILFEKHKFLHATTKGVSNVLIDDREKNINLWRDHSGIGILFDANKDSFTELQDELTSIFSNLK